MMTPKCSRSRSTRGGSIADVPTTIHPDDLARDKVRTRQVDHRLRNVLRCSHALQRSRRTKMLLLSFIEIFWKQHDARGDAVDANLRRERMRQRARHLY